MFQSRLAAALLAAAVALPVAALAQPAPAPTAGVSTGQHPHRGGRYMRVLRTLNLSDAQKEQIRTIAQNARQNNQNVTDPAQRRANMQKMRADIENVLTPDQRTKFEAAMKAPPGAPAR